MYSDIIFQQKKGENSYITYQLNYLKDKERYLTYLLPVLKEEYGLGESFDKKTEALSDEKKKILKGLVAKYNTPNPDVNPLKNGQTHLKPTRSKAGELIAKDLMKNHLNVKFAGRISCEEEESDVPKRGIDNFGFIFKDINGDIELEKVVMCEVKASDQLKNPPDVVEKNKDSLYKELMKLSKLDDRLMKALTKAFDRIDLDEYAALIASLMIDFNLNDNLQETRKKMMVVPFLLRTKEAYQNEDFGKFYNEPSEFTTTTIKYFIVVVDIPLSDFADDIYSKIRGENK